MIFHLKLPLLIYIKLFYLLIFSSHYWNYYIQKIKMGPNGPRGMGGPLKLLLEVYGDFNFHYIFIID